MTEFLRFMLRGGFKSVFFLGGTALAAFFVTENFASSSNSGTVFLVSWAVIAFLMFAFPEIWKWFTTSVV